MLSQTVNIYSGKLKGPVPQPFSKTWTSYFPKAKAMSCLAIMSTLSLWNLFIAIISPEVWHGQSSPIYSYRTECFACMVTTFILTLQSVWLGVLCCFSFAPGPTQAQNLNSRVHPVIPTVHHSHVCPL